MKIGRSLTEIAQELERQLQTRKDYIAPQGAVETKVVDGEVVLEGLNGGSLPFTPHAHSQIAYDLGIPKAYYDRMKTEQPQLLADNVNTWLQAEPDTKRQIRTLDGRVRAVLSPKFRPLDNYDLANVALPALHAAGAIVQSAELTETRMYIKAILPNLSDELPAGLAWGVGHHIFAANEERKVVSAIVIANSDVGAGTLRVEPSVYTALCTNLAVMKEAAMKKYHIGRNTDADTNYEVFHDDTRRADDKAFWLKVRDVLQSAFSREKFKEAIDLIRRAGDRKIVSADLPKVVEIAIDKLALPDGTSNDVLSWLARGGQLNQWGLSSAITRAAQDVDSYELATDMERAGGAVLALPAGQWDEISQAA